MDKELKLYTYVDGVNDTPFPSSDEQAVVGTFTYTANRMGSAPTLTFTLMHTLCLDDRWSEKVYASFNGERYYAYSIPTSSYSSSDKRYKHEVTLTSERAFLENVYFYDVVAEDVENDKPASNSSEVVFYGDIHEFAKRLQYSLDYAKLDYTVVVDDDVTSEAKLVSFSDAFFSTALQEVFNTYEKPYYFTNKEIHIGHNENVIDEEFEYGADKSLLSITKTNANFKIVNRCTGDGSSDNIPYYYPNLTPYGSVDALYNGSTTDALTVRNWELFAKCGLDGTFNYYKVEQLEERLTVLTIEDFIWVSEGIDSSLPNGRYRYKYTCRRAFNVDAAGGFYRINTSINDSTIEGYVYFHIEKYEDTIFDPPLTGRVPIEKGSNNTVFLPCGGYRVVATCVSNRALDEASRKRAFSVDVVQLEQKEYFGWQLNGEGAFIDPKGYGVWFDGEPKVGDVISFKQTKPRINTSTKLLPPIYRENDGKERFYNALNEKYLIPDGDGAKYEFSNEYTSGKPLEHIVHFEDIMPTIKNVVNGEDKPKPIDEFIEITYDDDDNDDVDEENKYIHPYFFAKLHKFNGKYGFNLFDHANENGGMTISMTTGNCGACEWLIGVDEESQKNIVQVYEEDTVAEDGTIHAKGTLMRDKDGRVMLGAAQEIQNDTRTNEVWIALKKEESTFGVIMPNATHNYRPSAGDKFVILNINLPHAYVLAAEKKLEESIIQYMSENNDDKFTFGIKFSRIYLAYNRKVFEALNENAGVKIKYNGTIYPLHISAYTYKMTAGQALPEITVTLADTFTVKQNPVKNTLNAIKNFGHSATYISDSRSSKKATVEAASVNHLAINQPTASVTKEELAPEFVSKTDDDYIKGEKTFDDTLRLGKELLSRDFVSNGYDGKGWGIYKDTSGKVIAEFDKIVLRDSMDVFSVKINQSESRVGTQIVSNAGCIVEYVEELDDRYRCYFDSQKGSVFSGFIMGDQALCAKMDEYNETLNNWYWCYVLDATPTHVDLSKSDKIGDGIPSLRDCIVQLGNRDDKDRQSAVIITSYPKPSLAQYVGINSYVLPEPVTKISPDDNVFTGKVHIGAGSTGVENLEGIPEAIQEAMSGVEISRYNLLRNSGFEGDYTTAELNGDDTLLNSDSAMFSPRLKYWNTIGDVKVVSNNESTSGYAVEMINAAWLIQTLDAPVIKDEHYIISFKGKGTKVLCGVGDDFTTIELGDAYAVHSYSFQASSESKGFMLQCKQGDNATICELQLERGDIRTAWGRSFLDNSKEQAAVEAIKYLSNAIKEGSTDIIGGLILSNMIMLGNYVNGKMEKVTAGMSGTYADDKSVALWGGGSYEDAIRTVAKLTSNNKEWDEDMANFVVTHGGDIFLRGYINALGGIFRGAVEIAEGKILLNADGSGHLADGKYSWNEKGITKISYPNMIEWVNFSAVVNGTNISLDNGGYIDNVVSIGDSVDASITYEMPSEVEIGLSICLRPIQEITRGWPVYPAILHSTIQFVAYSEDGEIIFGNCLYINTPPFSKHTINMTYNGSNWRVETDGSIGTTENGDATKNITIWQR